MEDHLRFAVARSHSFSWEGGDPFGDATFERPWHPRDSMESIRAKADAAFEMLAILDEITGYIGNKIRASRTRRL